MIPSRDYPSSDIDEVLERAEADLRAVAGSRILVTGGSGFVGSWFIRSVLASSRRMSFDVNIDLLVRDRSRACAALPDVLADDRVSVFIGDVVESFPTTPRADFVLHAATSPSSSVNPIQKSQTLTTIETGMSNLVDHVRHWSDARVLFTSSGAVYGCEGGSPSRSSEDDPFIAGHRATDAYRDGKRRAESMVLDASDSGGFAATIARLFAFLGPGVPLDAHFAAGNFIRDALAGGPVRLSSDGSSIRTYQYPTDMTVWLLALLVRGTSSRVYNVGSEIEVSIAELAHRIAAATDPPRSVVIGPPRPPSSPVHRYVPSTARIERELAVANEVSLETAVERTLRFNAVDARP